MSSFEETAMKTKFQISESVEIGIILALAGGFMDSYSYMCRGKVFANAQTGNMLLLGVNLSEGNFKAALHYFIPIISFAIGIALSDFIKSNTNSSLLHWRQISIAIEIITLFSVAFIPQKANLFANSITSLACGIQVESFRKIHGNGVATTMCIGNLRSGTEYLNLYIRTKNKTALKKGLLYYGIIVFFVIGAIIGNFFENMIAEKAILICCVILIIAFCLMFIDREKQKKTN